MSSTMTECVREALAGVTDWVTTEQAVDRVLESMDEVPAEFERDAVRTALKPLVRTELKKQHELDGRDTWGSIETVDEDGNTQRAYKQLTLMDLDERLQVRDTHVRAGLYHARKANAHTLWINADFRKQMPLPFPELGTEDESEGE